MTGELTLRGRVLPIGGLKEKLLAAVGAGMRLAIIPAGNAAELSEIPDHVRTRIKIEPVRTMEEVLPLALVRPLPRSSRKTAAVKVSAKTASGRQSGARSARTAATARWAARWAADPERIGPHATAAGRDKAAGWSETGC